jgi:membrane protein required for colicin V production
MSELSTIDGIILAVLFLALVRGVLIGLIRETFSIAALGGACIAVLYAAAPAAHMLGELSKGAIGAPAGKWIAAALIAVGTVTAVALVGRWVKRGAQAVGLGWADRIAGAVLGTAEGTLVVGLLLFAATWAIGNDHPVFADSQSVEAFGDLQEYVVNYASEVPDVAAPPR